MALIPNIQNNEPYNVSVKYMGRKNSGWKVKLPQNLVPVVVSQIVNFHLFVTDHWATFLFMSIFRVYEFVKRSNDAWRPILGAFFSLSLSSKWYVLKVSKYRKQFMLSSILPKNERWDNFMYRKLSQRSFFGRIEDTIICFRDCLAFSKQKLP